MDIISLNNRPYHHHDQYYNSESSGENLVQEEDSYEFYIPKEEAFADCPIFLAPMKHPVTDQYGHTFELEAINGWAASTREGAPLLCPVGREIIDPDRLVNNILGRDGIEHIHKLNGYIEKTNSKLKEHQKVNRDLKTRNEKLDKRLEVSYKQLESSNREKSELNERVQILSSTESGQMVNMMLKLIDTVNTNNDELKIEIKKSRKEIKEFRGEVIELKKEVAQLQTKVADQDSKMYVLEKECELYKHRLEKAVSIGFFQRLAVGITSLTPCIVDYDMKYITESGTEEMERAIVMLKQNEQHIKQASRDIQKANREVYVPINNTFIQEI